MNAIFDEANQFVAQPDGTVTVTVSNPLPFAYDGLDLPAGSVLPGENGVALPAGTYTLSIRGGVGGDLQVQGRPLGTAGDWEKAKKANGLIYFGGAPAGTRACLYAPK